MSRPVTAGEVVGILFLAIIFVVSTTIMTVVLIVPRPAPLAVPVLDERSPGWVPRVPGSSSTPVLAGQCGQFDGLRWHRIECPEAR